MRLFTKSGRARLFVGAAAGALAVSSSAWAQSKEPITIAPQPLSAALYEFGSLTSRQVMFAPGLTASKTTAGVSAATDEKVALAQLLQGTGLTYRREGDIYMIVQQGEGGSPQGAGGAGGAASTVEALIVTAQKREEDIQDVPIAISAFSQEALETHQIAGGPDLMTQIPNMTFTKTNFSSYSIQLRGIGTQAISATTDPGVAVAFNNTPFIQNRFFEQEFYDLQRVEVLRGPQGTLYGRNATAGVVNIISAKPKFIAEAKLSGDVANYNTTRIEGMVNIPLVEDMVALRLAGAWTKREGYATNELTGNPIDGRDLWSTRVSLRFTPSDAIDVNLIWEHFEEEDDRLRSGKQLCKRHIVTEVNGIPTPDFYWPLLDAGAPRDFGSVQSLMSQGCERTSLYSPDAFQTPNGAMLPYYIPLGAIGLPNTRYDPYVSTTQSHDLRVIESTVDPKYTAQADLGELQVSWDVSDNLTLASETAYATDVVYSLQDFNRFNTLPGAWDTNTVQGALVTHGILSPDGFFCDPQIGCSDRLVAIDISSAESRQFSQEFRLSSDFDGSFNFSLGANFLRYDLEAKYYVFFNSLALSRIADAFGSFNPYGGPSAPRVPWIPGVSDNRECLPNGLLPADPSGGAGYICVYIEPNSIENIQDQGHNYFLSKNPYKLISYAGFGEVYYNITDSLKITGGLRYTVDKKEAPIIPSWTLAGNSVGYPVREVVELEWREPTGRLAIDWKPQLAFTDETMVYASYAHGYKAGGANPPPMILLAGSNVGGSHASLTRPKTFDPEFVDALELGAKNTLADGKVTLNLAAFYYDYTGYQISEIVDRSAFNRNFDATVWGLEIEADWRPLENLKFGFKGGYENTRIKDGEQAIDLMDRTAGTPGWTIVRPFPTSASSCVLPDWLFNPSSGGQFPGPVDRPFLRGVGSPGGGGPGGCELAYNRHVDPMTGLEYVPFPTTSVGSGVTFYNWPRGEGTPGAYPGFNPLDESVFQHNNGEGFLKDLGGNQLPNAPNFTATLTVDYTVPLPNDWLATLHTDLYWQSESWWRVFDDHEYNKLDEYFTTNIAAIFTNEDAGWKVMAYVKNVFDRDSITGAFLLSDDTALVTNVFLTEPRLYGLRVTKAWSGGPLLGGFGGRHDGPYPFTLELGGQIQRHDAPNEAVSPSFMDVFSPALDPRIDQQDDLDWGDGREVKLTYRPDDTWKIALGARFGKTNGAMPWSTRSEFGDQICFLAQASACEAGTNPWTVRYNYTISSTADREEHTLVDFMVGKDIGIGIFENSALAAGLLYADLGSTTKTHIFGVPNWNFPSLSTKYPGTGASTHDRYDALIDADREFKGVGPVLSWEASRALLGNGEAGVMGLDWSLSGGVLFGDRKTSITGEEVKEHVAKTGVNAPNFPTTTTQLPAIDIHRSESVTVPTFGASLGLSYKVDRFSIGAGYRWERYQDAIDGGFDETKEEDRTIDGPYFKVSLGFGG